MSINTYRATVARLSKEIADLEKKVGDERKRIARLLGEINTIERSITRSTSAGTLQSKQRQIEAKHKSRAQADDKIADLSKKIAAKTAELHRTLKYLEDAKTREQKKQDAADKKRREEELRHARTVSSELAKQAQLHSEMNRNPLVLNLPEKIRVLFLAANPLDQDQLRLDEEIRAITEKIRMADYRDSVELISRWAVRSSDVLQALNEHTPHIIHFSGHGARNSIAFVDPSGNTKLVSADAIVQVINSASDNVQLVLFNSCFSSTQAQATTQHVPFAIGKRAEIGDEAARLFAAQFYSAIGFGRSVKNSFDQAIAALLAEGIHEENTPILFCKEGFDPELIALVKPDEFRASSLP